MIAVVRYREFPHRNTNTVDSNVSSLGEELVPAEFAAGGLRDG
jgi:hypothetical protein